MSRRMRGIARSLVRQAMRATGTANLAVAIDDEGPRLWVGRDRPGQWSWVLSAWGAVLDSGDADTWDEAMAVGLAALEVASLLPVD